MRRRRAYLLYEWAASSERSDDIPIPIQAGPATFPNHVDVLRILVHAEGGNGEVEAGNTISGEAPQRATLRFGIQGYFGTLIVGLHILEGRSSATREGKKDLCDGIANHKRD